MIAKRFISSVFLLLTYSFSFAHDIIPHCHHAETTQTAHETHLLEHDHSKHDKHEQEDHVLHADHLDEGLFDLIVCLLSEAEHPESNTQHLGILPEKTTQAQSSSNLYLPFFLAFVKTFEQTDSEATTLQYGDAFLADYQSVDLGAFPQRGPPSIA